MDSSATSPDSNTSVYSSPEFSAEPEKEVKIKTSVSVSNLAEKFEKSIDSTKSKDNPVTFQEVCENQTDKNQAATEIKSETSQTNGIAHQFSAEVKVDSNCLQGEKRISQVASDVLQSKSDSQTAGTENTNEHKVSNAMNDVKHTVREVNGIADSCVPKPSSAYGVKNISQSGSEHLTEQEISKAVEERVAFFAEKISKSSQTSLKEGASEETRKSSSSEVASQISLKDLEQSFVAALNKVNLKAAEAEKSADSLPVPSIQITEASDREDTSSEDSEEIKPNDKANEAKVETPIVKEMETSNSSESNDVEYTPSTTSQCEKRGDSVSAEERKAFFYISSTDLPENSVKEPGEDSELRHRPVSQEDRAEIIQTQQELQTRSHSCLCSKTTHGVIFLVSFVVAILGFILYNLAHEGKAPDFCEHLGLITAIIAGIIGAFSCFCFTCLEAFPRIHFAGYEKIRDAENARSENAKRNDAEVLDNESWSSEKERAFRRQNGMSSTRTSTASIKRIPTDHRELIDKTEKMKKEVVELLDSFSEMLTKLPSD